MTDLSEFYGPSSVKVFTDKGNTGVRANNIFVSSGEPNTNLTGDFVEGDMAIDIDASSTTYLFVYRYETRIVSGSSITAWYINLIDGSAQSVLRLIPNSTSKNIDATFVGGQATITVQSPIPPNFNGGDIENSIDIQYNIANDLDITTSVQNPLSSFFAITNSSVSNGIATLEIFFSAVEYDQGVWAPLAGEKTIYLVITVV